MKYVLSDIHGNLEAWESIKQQIKLTTDDELFILGDVIDRGTDGIVILKDIMNNQDNMHMLLGNHEYMMMNVIGYPYSENDPELITPLKERKYLWYYNGGKVTHKEFLKQEIEVQKWIGEYLQSLPLEFVVKCGDTTFILVHANYSKVFELCYPEEPEMVANFAVWDRDNIEATMQILANSGENLRLVIGHTPTAHFNEEQNEWPNEGDRLTVFKRDNLLAIDCGAAYPKNGGRLACIRLDDMKVFYSKESR